LYGIVFNSLTTARMLDSRRHRTPPQTPSHLPVIRVAYELAGCASVQAGERAVLWGFSKWPFKRGKGSLVTPRIRMPTGKRKTSAQATLFPCDLCVSTAEGSHRYHSRQLSSCRKPTYMPQFPTLITNTAINASPGLLVTRKRATLAALFHDADACPEAAVNAMRMPSGNNTRCFNICLTPGVTSAVGPFMHAGQRRTCVHTTQVATWKTG
jgi:hypothetical protein